MDFVHHKKRFSMIDYIHDYRNIFVLKSFTKIYALPGLRIGYGIGDEETVHLLNTMKTTWNVNCLAQIAGVEALNNDEYLQRTTHVINTECKFLYESLSNIKSLHVYPPEANFLLIRVENEGLSAPKLKQKLLLHNILITLSV